MIMKSNIEKQSVNSWIAALSSIDKSAKNSRLWMRVQKLVSLPRRSRVTINLNQLNKLAKSGEFVVVPGKVLGFGTLNRKFEIAAVEYSEGAVEKLKQNGCEIIGIDSMLKKQNPRLVM